jgi:hypothetical protein
MRVFGGSVAARAPSIIAHVEELHAILSECTSILFWWSFSPKQADSIIMKKSGNFKM